MCKGAVTIQTPAYVPICKVSKPSTSFSPLTLTKDGSLEAQLMTEHGLEVKLPAPCPVALSYNKEFLKTGSGDLSSKQWSDSHPFLGK